MIVWKWTGIPRVFRECKEYELPEPELIDLEGDFRVNMYRKAKGEFGVNGKTTQNTTQTTQSATQTTQSTTQTIQSGTLKLSEDDRAILEIIHDKPTMTQKEYALELGWKVDRVKYYLRKLKTQQILNRVGSIHKGHWELLIAENEWQR